MSLARDVQESFLVNELGSLLSTVAGLAFSILVIRKLGPVDYGRYTLVVTVAGAMVSAAALGFDGVIGRYVAAAFERKDDNDAALLFRHLVAVRSTLLALIAFALVRWRAPLAHWYGNPTLEAMADLAAVLGFAQGMSDLFFQLLASQLRMGEMRQLQVGVQCAALAGAVALIPRGLLASRPLLTIQAALTMAQLLLLLRTSRDLFAAKGRLAAPLGPIYRFAGLFWLHGFLTYFLASGLDVLVIGHFDPRGASIGFYNVSMATVGRLAAVLLGGFAGMGLPALSRAFAGGGQAKLAHAWRIFLELQALLVVPAFGYAFLFAPVLLSTLFSHRYDGAVDGFRLALLFNVAIYGLGCGLHGIALQAMGRPGLPTLVRIVTGPLNLVLDLVLVPRLGYRGAIVGTGIATIATVLGEWACLTRAAGALVPLGFLARLGTLTAAAFFAALPFAGYSLPAAILGGLVFAVVMLAGLFLLRPFTSDDHAIFGRQTSRVVALVRLFARPARVTRTPCAACGGAGRLLLLATEDVSIEICEGCGLGERRPIERPSGTPVTGAPVPADAQAQPGGDRRESPDEAPGALPPPALDAADDSREPPFPGVAVPAALELTASGDLAAAVRALAERMPPGSEVPLDSPAPDGWPAVLMGTRWPGVTDPRFHWYLTERALYLLGRPHGLVVTRCDAGALLSYPHRPGSRRIVRDATFFAMACLGRGDRRRLRVRRVIPQLPSEPQASPPA